MQSDIEWYARTRQFDRNYQDFFHQQDEDELAKLLDEFLREEQDRRTANGDEEMTDDEKAELTKVFRQQQLTKLFYDYDGYNAYLAKKEAQVAMQNMDEGSKAEGPPSPGSRSIKAKHARTGSQMSSIKDGDNMGSIADSQMVEDRARIGPPHDPLVPQVWMARLQEFASLNIVKFPRIFQTLFYVLQYAPREELCVESTNALDWKKCRHAFSSE